MRKAAQRDEAARAELADWIRKRPRTATEQVLLWRIRGVDKHGQGCYKPLADLAVGRIRRSETPDPETPKLSLRTARRALVGLRVRREVVFAGQVERGMNIWLDPKQRYSADKVPICRHRAIHHLWPLDEAKSLITGELKEPESLIIDGFKVNRRLAQEWNLDAIRRAIATIKSWYPDLSRLSSQSAMLATVLRQQLAGHNAVYAHRRSEEQKLKDEKRLKEVEQDLRIDRRKEHDAELIKGLSVLAQLLGKDKAAQLVAAPESSDKRPTLPNERPGPVEPKPQTQIEKAAPPEVIGPMTIRQQIEDFLRSVKIEASSQRTVAYYSDKAKALHRFFEAPCVEMIAIEHLYAYIELRREAGRKTATIKKELEVLSMVAKHFGVDLRSKSVRIKRLFAKISGAATREPKPLTFEEYQLLREQLPDNRRLLVDVAVYTGARASELFALRIEDFDFVRGRVHIRGTKTAKSDRWLPLVPVLDELVRPQQLARRGGHLLDHWHNKWKDLRAACVRAGIEPRSVLDFRHTFASWLKQAGCDSKAVGALMGHTTGKMVDEVYGHLDDRSLRAVIEHLPKPRPAQLPPVVLQLEPDNPVDSK
ncbi:MAG: site-specific integrase [Myxococcales bacterium]|nr:site-specific integrase [Myxococcales bacterium]